ncbi:uncharacterized protein LOC122074409 [Macadamia integrifolia]|uniref:uncharacterized protein LOC122074409 n=1 Tax=Macadamia integrifolia TaxID=60698 RepID=UPI001C4FCC32|nr:uncharacterized protein LOC122074409 [Macadamia integrifolia]
MSEQHISWSVTGLVSSTIPWVVLGDFNATLLSNEKRGPGTFNLGSAAEFQAMIDACLNVMQRVLLSSVSDHVPLLVISDIVPKPNNIPFRFHGFWMENENFLPVVDEAWKVQLIGDPIYVLSEKLKRVKGLLKVWARDSFLNLNMELEQATKDLKTIQDSIKESGIIDDLFNKEADAKIALLTASCRHEALCSGKAKLRWMKNGDYNSKLFHLSVKLRRAKNKISSLKREDGSWALDQRGTAEYIASFFEKFYKPTSFIEHHDLLDCIPKILSNEDLVSLKAIPGREEIKQAVWDIDPDSSPGPDGFLGKFFRKCWEIVETDFDEQGAFQKGKIISSNISLVSELANLCIPL